MKDAISINGKTYEMIFVSKEERFKKDPVFSEVCEVSELKDSFDILCNGEVLYSYLNEVSADAIMEKYAKHPDANLVKEKEFFSFLDLIGSDIIRIKESKLKKALFGYDESCDEFRVAENFDVFYNNRKICKLLAFQEWVTSFCDDMTGDPQVTMTLKCFSVREKQ